MDTGTKAILNVEQDARYGQLFAIALDELESRCGNDDEETIELAADAEAWRGLVEEWPELAKYDGAHAGVAE